MLIPAIITLEDGRKEARDSPDPSGFISAIFSWGKDPVKSQPYELDVLNCSKHGLALLLTEKDYHSLSSLGPGDRISGMTLFAASALTVVDGKVRHKTFIEDGPYKGCFVIGLETRVGLPPANRNPSAMVPEMAWKDSRLTLLTKNNKKLFQKHKNRSIY